MGSFAGASSGDSESQNSTSILNLFCGVLILAVGLFGIATNSSIITIYLKEKSEQTSFNLICAFRAASNIIILLSNFILIYFPTTILGFSIYLPVLESWMIHIGLTLYLGNEYQIILVALNRFCSLFIPTYYSRICGIFPTFFILSAFYTYRVVILIIEEISQSSKDCFTLFSLNALSWAYDPRDICKKEDNILDVIFYTFLSMSIINVIIFLKIISFYWKTRKQGSVDRETKKKIRNNIFLFFQTILQDSLYLIDLLFTFELSGLISHRFWTFICTTLVWECVHSIDGFIMMMFNDRLTFLKKQFRSTPSVTMTNNRRGNAVSTIVLPSVG